MGDGEYGFETGKGHNNGACRGGKGKRTAHVEGVGNALDSAGGRDWTQHKV